MKKIVSYLTIISLLLITFSCGGGGSSKGVSPVTISASFKTSSTGSAAMKAQATTLTNIRYTVTGSGMDTMIDTVPVTGNLVEFTLNVPNGPQRHFLVEALDNTGFVLYQGDASDDLNGAPITILITLIENILDISGSWILHFTPNGGTEKTDCFYIQQEKNSNSFSFGWYPHSEISLYGEGNISGNHLELSSGGGYYYRKPLIFSVSGTTNGSTITGTYEYSGESVSETGSWKAEKGACKKTYVYILQGYEEGWGGYCFQFNADDLITDDFVLSTGTVSGPNVSADMPFSYVTPPGSPSWQQSTLYSEVQKFGNVKPEAGATYTFSVTYSDGTTEILTDSIYEYIFDGPPVLISPSEGEIVNTLTPTFSWQPPPCNCQTHYWLLVEDSQGNRIWSSFHVPKETTSVVYNFDGKATQPLKYGETYKWYIKAYYEFWETSGARSVQFTIQQ